MVEISPRFAALLVASVILTAWAGWWVYRQINRIEESRRRSIKKRRRFEAIETETPLDHPVQEARYASLRRLERRFTTIRRLVIPSLIVAWLLIATPLILEVVPSAHVSLVLASFTVILGIAAKPFIENVIAGLVISLGKSIRIGDTVKVDQLFGTVEEFALTYTVVKVWDWRRYVIPNNRMLTKEFLNYSLVDRHQWSYVEFWVAPEADLALVEQLAIEAMASSEYFSPYEPPQFWVMACEKEAVRCWVAGWATTPSNAWMLGHEARCALMAKLRANAIDTQRLSVSARTMPVDSTRVGTGTNR